MDINYLLADTCVLSDIIRQYNPKLPFRILKEGDFLKKNMLRLVNDIIEDENSDKGYIVASTFAFLELINKFDQIFEKELGSGNISLERITAILQQPPSWLIIENVDFETAKNYCKVPNSVSSGTRISSDDAVHIATALQRGDKIYLLTVDHVLRQLKINNITVITD